MKESTPKALIVDGFILKILAFLFMTLDHLGVFLAMKGGNAVAVDVLRGIGRLAFPLFVFMVSEGMRLSRRKGRYLLRTFFLYALITLPETLLVYIPALSSWIGFGPNSLDPHPFIDIFFLCLLLYCLTLKGPWKLLALLPLGFFIGSFYVQYFDPSNPYFPYYLRSGYNLLGPVLALGFYGLNLFLDRGGLENRLLRNALNVVCLGVGFGLIALIYTYASSASARFISFEVWMLFSGVFLLLYNGKRGYDAPWWRVFSYSYFLLHMAVLYLIFAFI